MFVDFPKLECPFERGEVDGQWITLPKIKEDYRWVFTEEATAVAKLDGTGTSLWIRNGRPYTILNRTNEIDIWKKGSGRFIQGVTEAIDRGYIKPSICPDGPVFGELIGPKLQGNPYRLDEHVFVPFEYLRERYTYKFWSGVVEELKGKSDQEIFDAVEDIFKHLWCIYKRQKGLVRNGLGSVDAVDENSKFHSSMAAEGIVFYRKGLEGDYGLCCKLRRDHYSWSLDKHKGKIEK